MSQADLGNLTRLEVTVEPSVVKLHSCMKLPQLSLIQPLYFWARSTTSNLTLSVRDS